MESSRQGCRIGNSRWMCLRYWRDKELLHFKSQSCQVCYCLMHYPYQFESFEWLGLCFNHPWTSAFGSRISSSCKLYWMNSYRWNWSLLPKLDCWFLIRALYFLKVPRPNLKIAQRIDFEYALGSRSPNCYKAIELFAQWYLSNLDQSYDYFDVPWELNSYGPLDPLVFCYSKDRFMWILYFCSISFFSSSTSASLSLSICIVISLSSAIRSTEEYMSRMYATTRFIPMTEDK